MKTLTLLQPWASLVIEGHKKVETRSWQTRYRGKLLIHAGKGLKYGKESCREICYQPHFIDCIGGGLGYDKLPKGFIIGCVDLVDVVQFGSEDAVSLFCSTKGRLLAKHEVAFGDWAAGRFGWVLENPVKFKYPIASNGALSLYEYKGATEMDNPIIATSTDNGNTETVDAIQKMIGVAYDNVIEPEETFE